jgi:hypothetical protein
MWVRWKDGKPVEYRVRELGGRLPERDELGFDDEDKWEPGPDGKLVVGIGLLLLRLAGSITT